MANAYQYSNLAVAGFVGTAGGLTLSSTALQLTSTPSGYPNTASGPFKLVLDAGLVSEEIVKVTAGAGTAGSPWAVVRAWDGTTAHTHAQNTGTVQHMFTAEDETLSRTHEAMITSGTGVHGLPVSAWSTAAIAAIDETLLGNSTTAAVTWSSIPGTYQHLLLFVQGKFTENTLQSDDLVVTLNGSTGAVYSYVEQFATNVSGASTGALFSGQNTGSALAGWPMFRLAASQSGAAANAGGGWAVIPNYTSATFDKTFVGQSGAGNGSGAFVDMRARNGWFHPASPAAITSITLTAPGALFFTQGTFLGLYGIT